MIRHKLIAILKAYRQYGLTDIKLNVSTAELISEFERCSSVAEQLHKDMRQRQKQQKVVPLFTAIRPEYRQVEPKLMAAISKVSTMQTVPDWN